MITVVIKDNGEKSVIQMTYEDLWRELQDIPGAEIVVAESWFEALPAVKNVFVCFVEADCLVSGGFFSSQVGIFKKDKTLRKLGVMATATGVLNWANRVYGYSFGNNYSDGVIPNKVAIAKGIYPIQIAFIPGAIMRTKMIRKALQGFVNDDGSVAIPEDDLMELSVMLSMLFWTSGSGHRVAINPSTTYVTTEQYPANIAKLDIDADELLVKFTKAGIR